MARKRKKQILLLPPDREVEARRKKLPIFEAHDLRSLLAEAKASQHVDGDDAAVLAALLGATKFKCKSFYEVSASIHHVQTLGCEVFSF
jgi:hypothetical protein